MNSFVVLSAILGATMAAPAAEAEAQLIAGLGLAGHGLAYAAAPAVATVAASPVAAVHAAPVAAVHAAPAVAVHAVPAVNVHAVHTTVPVAVPTATVHKTVQTHLVPQ